MRANCLPILRRFLSVPAVPVLGIGALIFCLGHPKVSVPLDTTQPPTMMVSRPDPKLDKSRTILLRQQAKAVAFNRKRAQADRLAQAISGYNLIAQECTPAVFRATHLPLSMTDKSVCSDCPAD